MCFGSCAGVHKNKIGVKRAKNLNLCSIRLRFQVSRVTWRTYYVLWPWFYAPSCRPFALCSPEGNTFDYVVPMNKSSGCQDNFTKFESFLLQTKLAYLTSVLPFKIGFFRNSISSPHTPLNPEEATPHLRFHSPSRRCTRIICQIPPEVAQDEERSSRHLAQAVE